MHATRAHAAEPLGILQWKKALIWDQPAVGSRLVRSVVFAPDGKTLAACGLEFDRLSASEIKVWTVGTGEKKAEFDFPKATLYSIAFESDGQKLISGSHDGIVRVHDPRTHKTEVNADELAEEVLPLSDGTRHILAAGPMVGVFDIAKKKVVAEEVSGKTMSAAWAFRLRWLPREKCWRSLVQTKMERNSTKSNSGILAGWIFSESCGPMCRPVVAAPTLRATEAANFASTSEGVERNHHCGT